MYERSVFIIICIVIPQFREVDYCLDKLSISFLCRFFSSGSARLIQYLMDTLSLYQNKVFAKKLLKFTWLGSYYKGEITAFLESIAANLPIYGPVIRYLFFSLFYRSFLPLKIVKR